MMHGQKKHQIANVRCTKSQKGTDLLYATAKA